MPPWKDRYGGERKTAALGYQVARHRKLRDVEFAFEHAAVAVGAVAQCRALTDLEDLQGDLVRHRHRSIKEREVAVIAFDGEREGELVGHGLPIPLGWARNR